MAFQWYLNGRSAQVAEALDNLEETVDNTNNVRIRIQALRQAYQDQGPCPYGECACREASS